MGNILQVDATERGFNQSHGAHDVISLAARQTDRHRVDAAEILEQQRLAFHHRKPRFGPDVSQAEHSRAIGDHGDRVGAVRVFVDQLGICVDRSAGSGHTRRVPHREVSAVLDGTLRENLDLPPVERMAAKGFGRRLLEYREAAVRCRLGRLGHGCALSALTYGA